MFAVDRNNGALLWITQVDAHPAAVITGSPVFNGTTVYVGVSSQEEGFATNPAHPCCTFRGSMVALDVNTGAILWKTYVIPENGGTTGGYSGNAISSPPAIDPGRGRLYIGIGNNYTVPGDVAQCQADALANHDPNELHGGRRLLRQRTGTQPLDRRDRMGGQAVELQCVDGRVPPHAARSQLPVARGSRL